jgi:hypothetical protein
MFSKMVMTGQIKTTLKEKKLSVIMKGYLFDTTAVVDLSTVQEVKLTALANCFARACDMNDKTAPLAVSNSKLLKSTQETTRTLFKFIGCERVFFNEHKRGKNVK